jgi:hypothetical protein
MPRTLRVRIRGGHHTHAAHPSTTMRDRLTTHCGKTKWGFRFEDADGPVTCPGCLKAAARPASDEAAG